MTLPKIIKAGQYLWKQVVHRGHELDDRTNGWLGLVVSAANQALKPDSVISAAAISYFALFSLFPITLLCISIASFILGPLADQQVIVQKLEFIAPALSQLLGDNIYKIIQARGPVTGVAIVGLIWSASTIFYTFTQTLNGIWGKKRQRPVWKRRGVAILFVLALAGPALFLASFAGSMVDNLQTWLPNQIIPIGSGIGILVSTLLDITLFMVLYFMLPHGDSNWHAILLGSIGAGLFWELAKKAFLFFITNYISVSNLVYGSVAAIMALLTWAYISGLIFLFGAYLSVAYYNRKQLPQKQAIQSTF